MLGKRVAAQCFDATEQAEPAAAKSAPVKRASVKQSSDSLIVRHLDWHLSALDTFFEHGNVPMPEQCLHQGMFSPNVPGNIAGPAGSRRS